MKKILAMLLMSVLFSLSMHAAESEIVENPDAIRKELHSLEAISLINPFCDAFVTSAKFHYLAKLYEALSDDLERQAILDKMAEHVAVHPTGYCLARRALLHATTRKDVNSAVNDIIAASSAPESGNPKFDQEAKKLIHALIAVDDVKRTLMINFNELPHGKEQDDFEAFLKKCGFKVQRNLNSDDKRQACSKLALEDLISALRLTSEKSETIEERYCHNAIKEIAEDAGVQQQVEHRRQKKEIDEETEMLFKKHQIFQK